MKTLIIIVIFALIGCTKKVIKEEPLNIIEKKIVPEKLEEESFNIIEEAPEKIEEQKIEEFKEITETVYFKFDSDEFLEGKGSESVIDNLLVDCSNRDITIIGACCPIGEHGYNYQLGQKRAQRVARMFEGMVRTLNVLSYGEDNIVTSDKSQYWLNRRCEITIK